jgi:protein regulator of cytokinesis 1
MQPEKTTRTIKQQLAALAPRLEQLGRQKKERIKEFADIMSRIEQIRGELAGSLEIGQQVAIPQINEDDLTDEKLLDFQSQLQELEKKKVCISLLHLLCRNILNVSLISW